MFKNKSIVVILSLLLLQCRPSERKVVATIDGDQIFLDAVDSTISEKLYERLYDIYYNRKIALEHLVSLNLLKKEAINRNISVDSLLKFEVETKITQQAIDELIIENDLALGIPDPYKIGKVIDTKSDRGKRYLQTVLKRKLENDYVSILKAKYQAQINLPPPLSPRISLQDIIKYPINKSTGDLEILIISDFDCNSCQAAYPIFRNVIDKYASKVSFSYVPYATSPSESLSYSTCAIDKGINFYEVFSTLFESSGDTLNLKKLSQHLKVDHTDVLNCMKENQKTLTEQSQNTFTEISKNGIVKTPTLIIDGRVYYGEISEDEISNYINQIIM